MSDEQLKEEQASKVSEEASTPLWMDDTAIPPIDSTDDTDGKVTDAGGEAKDDAPDDGVDTNGDDPVNKEEHKDSGWDKYRQQVNEAVNKKTRGMAEDIASMRERQEELLSNIAALNDKIEKRGGEPTRLQQKQLDDAKTELDDIGGDIAELDLAFNGDPDTDDDYASSKKTANQLRSLRAKYERLVKEHGDLKSQLESGGSGVNDALSKFGKRIDEISEKMAIADFKQDFVNQNKDLPPSAADEVLKEYNEALHKEGIGKNDGSAAWSALSRRIYADVLEGVKARHESEKAQKPSPKTATRRKEVKSDEKPTGTDITDKSAVSAASVPPTKTIGPLYVD